MKILCFGDSITYGEIDTKGGGWADRLKDDFVIQYADEIKQEISLYNLGIGGETTDGLCRRFEVEFTARMIKGQATISIFSYGSNDLIIHKNKNIVPIEYFIRNIKRCIEFAQSNSGDVILASLTPIDGSINGVINQHNKLRYSKDITKYNSALKDLADDKKVHYLDLFTPFMAAKSALLCRDGMHPNSSGHELIYQETKALVSQFRDTGYGIRGPGLRDKGGIRDKG